MKVSKRRCSMHLNIAFNTRAHYWTTPGENILIIYPRVELLFLPACSIKEGNVIVFGKWDYEDIGEIYKSNTRVGAYREI